jgi:hypothetical protein
MVSTETHIYWIFTSQGREFHYPKAVWSFDDAKKHLEDYFRQVANFDSKRKK